MWTQAADDRAASRTMRLKIKWVLTVSACMVGLWLLVIIALPAPQGEERVKRGRQYSHQNHAEHVGEQNEQSIESHSKQVKVQFSTHAIQNAPEHQGDVLSKKADLESDPIEEEKKLSSGVEVEISQGLPQNGLSHDQTQNEIHPLEHDLLPISVPKSRSEFQQLWRKAGSWITADQITPLSAKELGSVLSAMAHARITKADVGFKGTQLKARFLLEGGQLVVFKPKRYVRDAVIYGTPYEGYDRHNGEIAAFHLDRVLGFRRAPLAVGRRINLKTEILPVVSPELNKTFLVQDGNTCFYGKCYYCKPEDAACAEGEVMEGSLTLWLPPDLKLKRWRHLWARTYKMGKKAKWETDDQYCDNFLARVPPDKHPLLLHLTDGAVFDYLIGNADRHSYETFEKDGDTAMMIHMDNAKSFGNPYMDEATILAPIYQCCRLRRSTWNTLQQYKDGRLSQVMRHMLSHDPVAPILTNWHLEALDRRLTDIIDTVHRCFTRHGEDVVLIN